MGKVGLYFKNVILVMTSNVGSRQILELVGRQRLERATNARKKKKRRAGGEESQTSFEDYVSNVDMKVMCHRQTWQRSTLRYPKSYKMSFRRR
jgi:hypothetical protein